VTEPIPAVAPAPQGSFGRGLAAAIGAAIAGAIGWAIITVVSDYRIGFVAVGIGFLVGLAIERFGGGDVRLPIAGAVIAVLGCVLGDLFIAAHVLAKAGSQSVTSVPLGDVWSAYTTLFRAFDGVFYAIAAYEGFRFGQRGVLRARAARAAHQPPSIEVPGAGPGEAPAPPPPPPIAP
jgi:hypothetical protein